MEIPIMNRTDRVVIPTQVYAIQIMNIKSGGIKVFAPKNNEEQERKAERCVLECDVYHPQRHQPIARLSFIGFMPATKKNKLGKAIMSLGIKLDSEKIDSAKLLHKTAKAYVKTIGKVSEDGKVETYSIISEIIPQDEIPDSPGEVVQ